MPQRTIRDRFASVAFGAAALILSAAPAWAVDIVIIESTVPSIEAGTILDSSLAVSVPAGHEIVIVEPDGSSRVIQGPYAGALGGAGSNVGNDGLMASLGKLVKERENERQVLGAIRAAPGQVKPEIYLVDVARSGTVCLPEGQAPSLWRPATMAKETEIAIAPAPGTGPGDDGRASRQLWRDGAQALPWPSDLSVTDDQEYLIRLEATPRPVKIRLRRIPGALASVGEQAAWMYRNGCRRQAERLLTAALNPD